MNRRCSSHRKGPSGASLSQTPHLSSRAPPARLADVIRPFSGAAAVRELARTQAAIAAQGCPSIGARYRAGRRRGLRRAGRLTNRSTGRDLFLTHRSPPPRAHPGAISPPASRPTSGFSIFPTQRSHHGAHLQHRSPSRPHVPPAALRFGSLHARLRLPCLSPLAVHGRVRVSFQGAFMRLIACLLLPLVGLVGRWLALCVETNLCTRISSTPRHLGVLRLVSARCRGAISHARSQSLRAPWSARFPLILSCAITCCFTLETSLLQLRPQLTNGAHSSSRLGRLTICRPCAVLATSALLPAQLRSRHLRRRPRMQHSATFMRSAVHHIFRVCLRSFRLFFPKS
jgi:hypothetical protein